MIARILGVETWRTEYLETLRRIAEVDLDWSNLEPRVDAYRALIERDVIRDPFHGDRTGFRRALYGDEESLKSFAAERRRFLLQHPELAELDAPPRVDDDAASAEAARTIDRSANP